VIRIRVSGGEGDNIRVAGRQTQGVTLFSVDENEKLVSVGVIQEKDQGDDDDSISQDMTPEDEVPQEGANPVDTQAESEPANPDDQNDEAGD
jgi:DNA gyrase subunit A